MKYILTILISILSLITFGQSWDQMIKSVASDREGGDRFGVTVDISGNLAVIGAFLEDHDEAGSALLSGAGSVYIFELTGGNWIETAKLVASDREANDRFGYSVSISGNKLIVGAYQESEDATGGATAAQSGSAYIFELTNGVWSETAKLVASDRDAGDNFGFEVSISGDNAIVGAFQEDHDASGANTIAEAGSAYIFQFSGGIWTETAKLVAADRSQNDWFGSSVSISGDKAVVGAYKESEDAAGGDSKNEAGSAYIFEMSGGVWSQTAKIVSSDRAILDNFGRIVCIDNNRVAIGAKDEDEDAAGGNTLTQSGSAYIFELSGGVWTETAKLVASDRAANDEFGFGICISGDRVIVGARLEDENTTGTATISSSGSAYIFEFNGGVWTETTKLVASDRAYGDYFGRWVSISDNIAVVGAYLQNANASGGAALGDAGAAYFYITCPPNLSAITSSGNVITATTTGATYQWLDCDNGNAIIQGETSQSFSAMVNGNYSVIVSSSNCLDTSVCVSITQVGIEDLNIKKNLFQIFPNPTKSALNVVSDEKIEAIIITDLMGKTVQSVSNPNNTIDVSHLTKGIYFLQIQIDNVSVSKRFIKE